MANNSQLFEHTQRYVREVMADTLRAAGFSSYKGEDIHWYRLVNNEVVQSIYFATRWAKLPGLLEIRYGFHPLFIPPVFQKSPYFSESQNYEQMYDIIPEIIPGSKPYGKQRAFILGLSNGLYSKGIWIDVPKEPEMKNGLMVLEKCLQELEPLTTPRACYEKHKDIRQSQIENESWHLMSPYFVDEVLFWEDKSLYDYCEKYTKNQARAYQKGNEQGWLKRKTDIHTMKQLVILDEVFTNGTQKEYVNTFVTREQETLKLLQKYAGICAER